MGSLTEIHGEIWALFISSKSVSCSVSAEDKSYHDANFVIIGGTTGCHNDNLWCRQQSQSWHHDNFGIQCWSFYLHWKQRVVMMPILPLLAAPQIVIMTICGATSNGIVGVMTISVFSVGLSTSTENKELSWCQFCHYWRHHRLS